MSTPLATVANAIIDFILSLLRDPAALAQFEQDPEGTLARNGLDCVDVGSIRAAAPVVYDRPEVVLKQFAPPATTSVTSHHSNEIVREYSNMAQTFTWVDSRATIVDQSTNQNIWTEGGDVAQVFDQVAGVASGDAALAAGDDIGSIAALDADEDAVATFPTGDAATPLSPEEAAALAGGDPGAGAVPTPGENGAPLDGTGVPAEGDVLDGAGGEQLIDPDALDGLPEGAAEDVTQAVGTATLSSDVAAATTPAAPEPEASVEPVAAEPVAEPAVAEPVVEYVESVVEESDWDASDDAGLMQDDGLYQDDMTEEQ